MNRNTLGMPIPSAFACLENKVLYHLFNSCTGGGAASDPAKENTCCAILTSACLEYSIYSRRQWYSGPGRAGGDSRKPAEYDGKLVVEYIDAAIDRYKNATAEMGPGGTFSPKAAFTSAEDARMKTNEILNHIAWLGYDVNMNRGLFHQKIFPLIAVTIANLAMPLIVRDMDIPYEIKSRPHILRMSIVDILLDQRPIIDMQAKDAPFDQMPIALE